jgi:hypothetical protein
VFPGIRIDGRIGHRNNNYRILSGLKKRRSSLLL